MTPDEPVLPPEAALPPEPELPPAPPPKRGPLALLVGVIAWPRSTFRYLRDHGGLTWLVPLVLALVLTVAARAVAVPIERAEAEAAMAALQEQIEAMGNGEDGGGVFFSGPIGGPVGVGPGAGELPAVSPLAEYGLPALSVVWDWVLRGGALLGLAWVLGGRPTAGAMFRMSGWTLLPDIARLVVMLAVMLGTNKVPARGLTGFEATTGGPIVTSIDGNTTEGNVTEGGEGDVFTFEAGPGGVMRSGEAPGMGGLFAGMVRNSFLTSLDIYTLWALVLLVIGVAVTAKLGWIKATLTSLVYFGLSVVLAALPPLLSFWLVRFTGGGPAFIR
jgi:hypothetical protein